MLGAALLSCGVPALVGAVQHYEYVFPDQAIYVYDEDNDFALVKQISLPRVRGTRGAAVSVADAMLFISYGGDGGVNGNGSMLKYDLLNDAVVWTRDYATGIDSMAISPDGKKLYMPIGELTRGGIVRRVLPRLFGDLVGLEEDRWTVIDTSTGDVIGGMSGGPGPHNTVVSLDGAHVYLGSRFYRYLLAAETATNQVIKKIGPLRDTVRPFTINGTETLAYTTATHFLGFQVSDITTGRVLYTVDGFGPRFPYDPQTFPASTPSHGISLSPDEHEIYVIDAPNSHVHVFDVSAVPATSPRQVADIAVRSMAGEEEGCLYDCVKDGWIQHSRDGRFVFVGDCGDVIDAASRRVIANLPALRNTRKHLEINWQNGKPISTSTRSGMGYGRRPP
jgi:DNA-binding beta-propeller fold protein YncE